MTRAVLAARRLWKQRKWLVILLAASFILRIALIWQGGPLSWPDDIRFFRTNAVLEHLGKLEFGPALDGIIKSPDHTFFAVVALIPATTRLLYVKFLAALGNFFGLTFATDLSSTIWIAAAVLSLASVINIGLVYGLARKTGAEEPEALFAAFLMATATSTFHLTRFLVPYEASLTLALTAMWIGLDATPGFTRFYLSGLMGGVAYFTYNAHWTIVAVILATIVLRDLQVGWSETFKRATAGVVGLVTPLALLTAANLLRGTELYVTGARRWSKSVIQGDFAEGWSLPWAYFWHAEHTIVLVWVAGAIIVVAFALRRTERGAGLLWLTMALGVYLLLILSSNVLHLFVVTGRFANQMVPFLCLATAYGVMRLSRTFADPRKFILFVAGAISLQAAYNFAQPFRYSFPYVVRQRVEAEYGQVAYDVTIYSTSWRMNPNGQASLDDFRKEKSSEDRPRSRYVLVNSGFPFLPIQGPKPAPAGKVLWKVPHMLAYRPYHYQAFKPKERAVLESTDLSIELIDTADIR